MFQKINFDTQDLLDPRFIPLFLSLTFIFIRRTNEMAFQFRYFPSHRRLIADTSKLLIQPNGSSIWQFNRLEQISQFKTIYPPIFFFSFNRDAVPIFTPFSTRERTRFLRCVLGRLFIIILAPGWSCVRSNYIKRKDGRADKAKYKIADTC